ncbi:putative G-protein coupled receptor Mth-like 3 [Armadillidium nasatum]|uniref:Putative G-protein coupled receptor Mth-like 3 n=1 Tax=Armadillidium nasatum TaxID=96803 RepID=A0A5N5SVC8_9CRUS|nr:putative G-protein coupled receptor Mth-like 3 [Armadillidium nasatum]
MGISAIFLAATFIIYCLVNELQDLLGKSFMCSIITLCFSKVFGVIGRTISNRLSLAQCISVGMLMHLGFLLAFFWLNVISLILFVSVWWFTFGSIYAFGIPCLIMILIMIHDFTNQFDNSAVPKPGFGVASCGFTNRGAQVVYFYAPISILLGINLVLFCASACRLFLLSKQSSAFVFQFNHYLKLLVLMGIPWIFEVLSFFFSKKDDLSTATFIWLAFDIFNSLQGVIIFIVFACRRAVFARVSETVCGSDYARKKYPDVFLQHANEETNDVYTQHDLRLMEAETRS